MVKYTFCQAEREYQKLGYLLQYQALIKLNHEYFALIEQLEKEFNDPVFGNIAEFLFTQLTEYIDNQLSEHAKAHPKLTWIHSKDIEKRNPQIARANTKPVQNTAEPVYASQRATYENSSNKDKKQWDLHEPRHV